MLILASKSPRRQELLKKIYPLPYKVVPADIDEESIQSDQIEDRPFYISQAKGEKISKAYPLDYVLAADTMVLFEGEEFGKPKDENDAVRMLSALNEKSHFVLTGYHIFHKGKDLYSGMAVSEVILHGLSQDRIQAYIKTGSPFDKAGAYGIQDKDFIASELLSGSYENVMGLPLPEIEQGLKELKLI